MQAIPILGGRYRLGPEIASGGMGAVHRAWDERFDREVAIKVVRSGADRVERERLRREAQYLAHIDHPNLVAVLDAGEDRLRSGDTVWFAMELVAGPDLRALLRRDGAMDGAAARRVLRGVLAALEALHTAGVVHRDLKPANVLLTAEPVTGRWDVKVVDLGIAHLARTDHLTGTGQVVGTAAYLSPEQVRGRAIGPATDVYALGLLVLEILTGTIAFPGGPAESAAARLVRGPDLPSALDPAWRRVLTGMTSLDPADRPAVATLLDLARGLPDVALRPDDQLDPTEVLHVVPAVKRRDADATAVMPAPRSRTDGAHPAAHPRRRRHLLAGACLLAVLAAAAGWTAALSGTAQQTAAAAPSTAVSTPAAARTPRPTPTLTSTPTPTATPVVVPPPAPVETPSSDRDDERAEKIQKAIERFRQKVEEQRRKDWEHR